MNFEASAQAGGRVRVQIPGGGAPATMTEHVSRLRGVGANPRVLSVTYSNQMGVTNALGRYPPGTRFSVWGNRESGQIGHVFGGQIDGSGAVRFLETQSYTSINWGGYSSFNIIIH